jgi:ribosome-associated protein
VNKVETAVIASWQVGASALLNDEQKEIVLQKLSNRISSDGFLQVKAQTHRTQLSNKEEAVTKINELVKQAITKKKARIATKVSKAAKERRIESKKRKAEIKSGRQKFRDF